MVTPATDPEAGKTRWAYDPHLDPALQFDPARARHREADRRRAGVAATPTACAKPWKNSSACSRPT
jgi:hypothetical protein